MRYLILIMFLGVFYVGISTAGALTVGEQAPVFSLEDQSGSVVNLSDYKDNVVVLEWINPDCPYVQRHYNEGTMKKLSKKYNKKIVWLAINSTHYMDNKVNSQWRNKYLLEYAILNDNGGDVGKSYGAKTTPHMFIIDNSTVVYAGAIDDDKWGRSAKRVNYVDIGLAEILNGGAVTTSETKPYGCSVKYK